MKYIKNNPEVEAIQWTNAHGNFQHLREWTGKRFGNASPLVWKGYKLNPLDGELITPDGAVLVRLGTWVVKHSEGIFYPVSDGCFKSLYKPHSEFITSRN